MVVVVPWLACGDAPSVPSIPCSGGVGTGGGGGGPVLALTGTEAAQKLEVFAVCETLTEARVTADVYDPNNLKVPATVTDVVVASSQASAVVRFTPQIPGRFHVTARFEPNLGLRQADVWVAHERVTETGVPVALPKEVRCARPLVLPSGGVLCRQPSGARLELYRGGASVQRWTDVSAVAVDGEVVWTGSTFNGLKRWRDVGSGALVAQGELAAMPAGTQLLPLPGGDVLAVGTGGARRAGLDAGQLVAVGELLSGLGAPLALSPDGTRALSVSSSSMCVGAVPGGGAGFQPGCTRFDQVASLVGGGPTSFFLSSGFSNDLVHVAATDRMHPDGGLPPLVRTTLGSDFDVEAETAPPLVAPRVVHDRDWVLTPRVADGELRFERWVLGDDLVVAFDDAAFVTTDAGTRRVAR